ncbi:hypothetical protein ACIBCD_11105 [Nocardia brasiliensis]|uniref:hypothetical protein n=1 Tax=Nocardia brasiliensis TaxID=37326 RepID=UPI003791DA7E
MSAFVPPAGKMIRPDAGGSIGAASPHTNLVFPDHNGNIRDPHNCRRTWRQARGSDCAWITPKTFRKTVATVITHEYGVGQAGLQLGHRRGSKVTEEHYVERDLLVPDSSAALERFAGDHPTAGKVRDSLGTSEATDRAEAS